MDGGEPKTLSPLDTLEAHQKGAAVMAASPDGRFMATGGADGLVCLWMVYENQVRAYSEHQRRACIAAWFVPAHDLADRVAATVGSA